MVKLEEVLDVWNGLRRRVQTGELTLTEAEAKQLIRVLEELTDRVTVADQVVGELTDYAGKFKEMQVQEVADLVAHLWQHHKILPVLKTRQFELVRKKHRAKTEAAAKPVRKKVRR